MERFIDISIAVLEAAVLILFCVAIYEVGAAFAAVSP